MRLLKKKEHVIESWAFQGGKFCTGDGEEKGSGGKRKDAQGGGKKAVENDHG